MRERQDFTGEFFGRLEVIGTEVDDKGKSLQICRCSCDGKILKIHTYRLKNGSTVSCGCHSRDKAKERMLKVGAKLASKYQMHKDLAVKIGDVFDMLTVDYEVDPVVESNKKRRRAVMCKCSCGNSKVVTVHQLLSGNTRSCGCARKMGMAIKHGAWNQRSPTAEYKAWQHAKDRCYNPMCRNYADYGGRGIAMSDEWRNDFERFLCEMGCRPSMDHSLDRRDVNGPYSYENCRWATKEEQVNNRRVLSQLQKIEREKLKIQIAQTNIDKMEKEISEDLALHAA